jgi:hypothetical protein
MHRGLLIAASLLLALSALTIQAVALPARTLGCSCVAPLPSLEEIVGSGDDVAVLVGTVGQPLAEMTPIEVEQWFHGARPADVVWINGGQQMMTSCDVMVSAGQRHFLVLYGAPGQPYSTSLCAPNALIGSDEGVQLVAEAEEVFGLGRPPPSAEPEPQSEPEVVQPTAADAGGGLLWVLAGVAGAVLLFAAVMLVALRRPAR